MGEELVSRVTQFSPDAVSFSQLQQMRKSAGLPWGYNATFAALRKMRDEGKVRSVKGAVSTPEGIRLETRYELL